MRKDLSSYGMTTAAKPFLVRIYETMLRIRMFEEKIVELYPAQEMKCPVHLCIGQEAIAAGVCAALEKRDYLFSNHRGHGHLLAKGSLMGPLFAEIYGRATGCSRGKGGSMHLIDVDNGIMGTSAIVGGGIPIGVGSALASQMRNEDRVTTIFFGDGAFEEGVFYESFNFAALKSLPVVFVCENNFYATNSPQKARQAACKISETAAAFGGTGVCVDGNDALEVYMAANDAVTRARDGLGPALIEAKTYRWKGHVGPGPDHANGDRTKEELDDWMRRCPIDAMSEFMLKNNIASLDEMERVKAAIVSEIEEAVVFAKASPLPALTELLSDVFA